jgi:hypothetical protein
MGKIIKLRESSFKRLLEYVGDEEALGRYDLSENPYIPEDEKDSIVAKKSTDTIFKDNSELDEPEYMGQEINDPGPYALFKRMN